jgi:branched-chain amino acid transport system ATP-binding protein
MAGPKLLLLDEPSLGLAPRTAEEILRTLAELNRNGLTILLVEQKAPLALEIARRAYVMASGSVITQAPADEIRSPEKLARLYFAHA